MKNITKELPDGTFVDSVNHLKQSPKDNLIDMIAGFFCIEKLTKEQAIQLYHETIEIAQDFYDFFSIGDSIIRELKDFNFARQVYKLAEEKALTNEDFSLLSDSVKENFSDLVWSKNLLLVKKKQI